MEGKGKRRVREETDETEETEETDDDTLQTLLLGPPLNAPRPCLEAIDARLASVLDGIPDLMRSRYGNDTEASREAMNDVQAIADLPPSKEGVCCKRAALLFGLKREPELQRHFLAEKDPPSLLLASDLVDRVLPFVDPCFVKHSCQAPDSYVTLAVLLSRMFGGERLGNWPKRARTTTAPLGC